MSEQSENSNNVNITVEQILAAIIRSLNGVKISVEELVDNYSGKQIKIEQDEDGYVIFSLAENETKEVEND